MTYQKFEEINKDIFKRCEKLINDALSKSGYCSNQIKHVIPVGGSCHCPTIMEMLYTKFNKESRQAITDFEMTVAKGLAKIAKEVQKGIVTIDETISDIATKEISVEIMGYDGKNKLETIFERGTQLPKTEKKIFVTQVDEQTSIKFNIFEDKKNLMTFYVNNLPPMKKSHVEVEISFTMLKNGRILIDGNVVDQKSSSIQYECVSTVRNLEEEEIEEMRKQVEELFHK